MLKGNYCFCILLAAALLVLVNSCRKPPTNSLVLPSATQIEQGLQTAVVQQFGGWLEFARCAATDRQTFMQDLTTRQFRPPKITQINGMTGYNAGHGRLSTAAFGFASSDLFVIACEEKPLRESQFVLIATHYLDRPDKGQAELVGVQVFVVTCGDDQCIWLPLSPIGNPNLLEFVLVDDQFKFDGGGGDDIIVEHLISGTKWIEPGEPP